MQQPQAAQFQNTFATLLYFFTGFTTNIDMLTTSKIYELEVSILILCLKRVYHYMQGLHFRISTTVSQGFNHLGTL